MKVSTPHLKTQESLCETLPHRASIRSAVWSVSGCPVTAQHVEPDHTVLRCRPTTPPLPCPGCARPGVRHDTVLRRLAHVLFGWKPTILEVVVPRYRCWPCRRIWRHSITAAALSKGKLSREAIMVAVKSIVVDADVDRPGRGQPRRGMEY